jgi:RNA polymerase sigma-70 factor (ECF subfamily)
VEQTLVDLARRGDRVAFSELASAITPRLFAVANRILRDYQLAEDATQQALVQIWRKLPKLDDVAKFEAWCYRILVNLCYAEARRRRRTGPTLELLETDVESDDGTLSVVQRDSLDRAFARLPAEQRAVLVLQYYLDLEHAAIAELLAIPLGTVKSRASSGRQAMRAALEADARMTRVGRWTA